MILKKTATIWGLLAGLVLPGGLAAAGESDLARFHRQLLTIDSHDDIPPTFATPEADPGRRGAMQVDLVKMAEGGLDTVFLVVYVGQTRRTPENYARAQAAAMVKFNAIHRMVRQYPERIGLAWRADDIEHLHAAGKLAAVICIENGYVIGKDLALLDKYYALGARYMTLTHMGHNDIADSSNPKPELGDAAAEHGGVIGWSDAAQSMNVTRELLKRGYSRADIAKIWGGNLLRVMRQVEHVATRLKMAQRP